MMLRGLRVVDFSGENPSPRQLLYRAAGYMLSAGTFFLGFLCPSGMKTNSPGMTASRAPISAPRNPSPILSLAAPSTALKLLPGHPYHQAGCRDSSGHFH